MITGTEIVAGIGFVRIFEWIWKNFGKDIAKASKKTAQKKWKEFINKETIIFLKFETLNP